MCFQRRFNRQNALRHRAVRMRRGLTMVELLVVIAIVAILMSLLVSGVMSARESARRMQCASHLKQVGIAIQNYESMHGYLPCSGLLGLRYLSTFVEGLPGNWDVYGTPDPCMSGPCPEVGEWAQPKIYLCPSDPLVHRTRRSASYVFSSGLSLVIPGQSGVSDGYGAADSDGSKALAMRDIADGTSNTACASEQLIAPIRTATTPEEYASYLFSTSVPTDTLRHTWFFAGAYSLPAQLDSMFAECDGSSFAAAHSAGNPFNVRVASYSHVRTPNTRSCVSSSMATAISSPINPPTSQHPQGVNLLMCDGSVRFVSNSIDRTVWHAVGTRSSGETVGEW